MKDDGICIDDVDSIVSLAGVRDCFREANIPETSI